MIESEFYPEEGSFMCSACKYTVILFTIYIIAQPAHRMESPINAHPCTCIVQVIANNLQKYNSMVWFYRSRDSCVGMHV